MHSRAHFRLLGVPVRIEPFFIIVAALFGIRLEPLWLVPIWMGLVAVSVLVHEMGHAIAYKVYGQQSAVVLHGFGGFTIPAGGGRRALTKRRSITVSVAGALSQLVLLWLPTRFVLQTEWAAQQLNEWRADDSFNWWPVLSLFAFINLWWALINLLPIRPLDGGHVAEEVVGFENAARLSIVAAVVAGFFAFRELNSLFALFFFGLFAFLNYRDLKAGQNTGAFDVPAPESTGGSSGRRRRSRGGGRGRRGGPDLRPVPSPSVGAADLEPRLTPAEAEARAWNALRSGDGRRAAALLTRTGENSVSPFLLASVALAGGAEDKADELFANAYRAEPAGPPNLVPATLLADHDRAEKLAARLVTSGPAGVEAASSLQTHLHYAERFRAAAEVGEQVYAAGPRSPAQTAFEVACSWSRAHEADTALRWVATAVDDGFRAPGLLDGEPDLAAARARPGWAAIRARLSS